ncbi:hypothetical protein BH23VER1_BH23VER1_32810 [soil metagenome]
MAGTRLIAAALGLTALLATAAAQDDELILDLPPIDGTAPAGEPSVPAGEDLDLGLPPLPGDQDAMDDLELGLPPLPGAAPDPGSEPSGADLDLELPDLDLGLPPIGTESPDSTLLDTPSPDAALTDQDDPATGASAGSWTFALGGYLGGEATCFPASPPDPRQHHFGTSLAAAPELEIRHAESESTFRFAPFARWDQRDHERTHADLRELSFLKEFDNFDVLVGVSRVFWGTTEAAHLVDVINQTDLVEDIDQEAKLGQPMANVNVFTDLGRFSFYALPYFRERTFPGADGRLRTHPRVDGDRPVYESAAEEWHTDLAFRYSRAFGDLDLGLSYFWGTVREPTYLIDQRGDGEIVLLPFYEIVHQPGLDLSYTWQDWLFKSEAFYRSGQAGGDFLRAAAGFEFTFFGIFGSAVDLGVIGEFLYDSASNNDINPFENDIAYGLRFAFNDLRDTTVLLSAITDPDDGATFLNLEASMRFGGHWVARAEARAFANVPADDFPLNGFRRDHYLRLGLEYHF